MNQSQQIVQKLWGYCTILRDDGLSYPDYVEQLTYLLFLKMADEQALPEMDSDAIVPKGFDWKSLLVKKGKDQHAHYGAILRKLASSGGMLGVIFHAAENKIRDPAKLNLLIVELINKEQWTTHDADVKGDAYEGLMEKNAQDTKSGAGQYFTPRSLIRAIVEVVRPVPGEVICDPACGTCGFLLVAHSFIRTENPKLKKKEREHLRLKAIRGMELVPAVTRLGAMNLLLHGIGPGSGEADLPIHTVDSLAKDPGERYDVVLTNPPFGKRSSVTVLTTGNDKEWPSLTLVRDDFWASTANKQLNFVQHVHTILKPGGRAALVIPDNVLFEGGPGEVIRRKLLDECDVHTILRLPTGIFYAQGVKANVLFFDRPLESKKVATKRLWIYDLRTNFHVTLKENPLQRSDLDDFVSCYKAGNLKQRRPTCTESRPTGRWRSFTYEELTRRDKCSLDITWLTDEGSTDASKLPKPAVLAAEIVDELQAALAQLEDIAEDMRGGGK
jgi:type I restriction enzyme M protein